MDPTRPLPENAVHVWYTLPPKELENDLRARYLGLLAPEERRRHDRFLQEKDRLQYLLGKVLVRTALSRYYPLTPEAWTFSTNRFGKPVVANSLAGPVPRFNL